MVGAFNLVVFLVYLVLPLSASASDSDFVLEVEKNEIKVMSYNVENLFDSSHDEGKKDYEFLPKNSPLKKNCYTGKKKKSGPNSCADLDWTAKKIKLKLAQIKKVLVAQGSLPDVLVLVEVENKNVVGQLAKYLGYDGFKMTNSPDLRGIDLAILYLTEKLEPLKYYQTEVEKALFPTRNLSVMTFRLADRLGGGVLGIFPNHWPSQLHNSTGKSRLVVADAARDFIDEIRSEYKDEDFNFIVTGDFNTLPSEKPNPVKDYMLDKDWTADLADVRALAKKANSGMLSKMPKATYYYAPEDTWNEFDYFFVSGSLYDKEGLEVLPKSYRIHAPGFLTKRNKHNEKVPLRYNHKTSDPQYLGYSDHFGIVVKLRYNE